MYTLAINTASSTTAIALFQDNKLLSEDSWPAANKEGESLLPAIKKIVHNSNDNSDTTNNTDPNPLTAIQKIICISGPGSFTGLRVGVTTANTIAHTNKAELHAITTFEFWHKVAPSEKAIQLVFAGKKGLYVNGIETPLEEVRTETAYQNIQAYGDITPEQKSQLQGTKFIETSQTFGQIIEQFDHSKLEKLTFIKPNYVKAPSITMPKCSS